MSLVDDRADAERAPPDTSADGTGDAAADDPFMKEAKREFEAGQIEQPLWLRALDQAGGNARIAKPGYLRARAASLRVERRGKQAERMARRDREAGAETHRRNGSSGKSRSKWQPPGKLDGQRIAIAVGALAAVVVAIVVFVAMRPGDAPTSASARPGAVAPAAGAGSAARRGTAKSAEPAAGAAMSGEDFARKVQEFKDAGNWNVLVLYAVEWTRKQPANPDAWKELGAGYIKLRQYEDALEATRKALQLSPNDFQSWQDLGQINVALRQPAAAVAAFEKATELNGHDLTSLVQAGMLNVELGRLPEAKAAFASALALNANDVDALCGTAAIARKEGRTKDAETVARQLKSSGLECREPEAASRAPAAAVNVPTSKKPAPARGR